MKRIVVLSLLLLLPLAACGDSQPPSAEETARAYVEAQEAGDWEVFCDTLTDRSQDEIRANLVQKDKKTPTSCPEAITGSTGKTEEALKKAASVITIKSVDTKGDRAVIVANTPGGDKSLGMVQENGSWRVALVP